MRCVEAEIVMAVTLTLEQLADHLRLDRAAATATDLRYTVLSVSLREWQSSGRSIRAQCASRRTE